MKHYLITWHETDGNDATVFDTVIRAKTEENAVNRLFKSWLEAYPGAEEDGDMGLYFECDCDEENVEYCEGHGGTIVRSIDAFDTLAEANDACANYHSPWTVANYQWTYSRKVA